jgi:hypothetical protein
VIHTEEECERLTGELLRLDEREALSPEETELSELLTVLIEEYVRPAFLFPRAPAFVAGPLNKQIRSNMKKLRQLLSLRLADRALAANHFGRNSFGPKNLPQIFLPQPPRLHQMLQRLPRTSLPNRIPPLLNVPAAAWNPRCRAITNADREIHPARPAGWSRAGVPREFGRATVEKDNGEERSFAALRMTDSRRGWGDGFSAGSG